MVSRLPPLILKALLMRGAVVWLFGRFMAHAVFAMSASFGGDGTSALIPYWVIAMSPAIVLIDLHRRKETTLLNNLGVPTRFAVAVGGLPSLLFEGIVAVAVMARP